MIPPSHPGGRYPARERASTTVTSAPTEHFPMKKKQNNSMRASALQITFISLLAILLTLGAAPARNDSAGGSWAPTGSLSNARYFHTATLLSSGQVLVAGGRFATPNT